MPRRRKLWMYSAGRRGRRVVVYEREPGGNIQARTWDRHACGGRGGMRRLSLGHTDRERAKEYAEEQAALLARGRAELQAGRVTWDRLFRLYLRHQTPEKAKPSRKNDERAAVMWLAFLGPQSEPSKLRPQEWQSFIRLRRSGAIDARGCAVPEGDRSPVRDRTVEYDLKWLRAALNWGCRWRDQEGRPLLREDPARGLEIPRERSPRQPVASTDRYEALLRAMQEAASAGDYRMSLLRDLFVIVAGTGRRLSAVCQLTYADLQLDSYHHGAIRWPAATDKTGRESVVPMAPEVRAAVDRILRERPGIGSAPLFPSCSDASLPVSRHLADKWLRAAEVLAGLEPQEGSLWHAYRRGWATCRKHLPAVDVAAVGGWAGPHTLQLVYQKADPETMLQVVLGGNELREVRR